MRKYRFMLAFALPVALAAGCASEDPGALPPADSFHYPVSVAVLENGDAGPNVLYVASSNFDLAYSKGSVVAVDLDKLGDTVNGPVSKAVDSERGFVYVDSFAGMMGLYQPQTSTAPGVRRLFLPTRANNRLYALHADGAALSCRSPDGSADDPRDCSEQGTVLAENGREAEDPFDLAFHGSDLYVTHLRRPFDGEQSFDANLVHLDAETAGAMSFIDIGAAPSEGIVDTPAGLYFTGRALLLDNVDQSEALRTLTGGSVVDAKITDTTRLKETRGIAVSSDGKRLFVATRGTRSSQNPPDDGPDGLLVVDISADPVTGLPRNETLGFIPTPLGASRVLVLPRPGRRDLIAVSCTDSDMVVLYDDEVGAIVRSIAGIRTPYGMASATRQGGGKRLFVASFENHTVDVIDVPDLSRPAGAALVGRLGGSAQADAKENP